MLTGLHRFVEANGMGKIFLILQWYTQKLIKMLESYAQYTTGINAENTFNIRDDSFNIF